MVAGAVFVEGHAGHPLRALAGQPMGGHGFREGFGCHPGRRDVKARGHGRTFANPAAGPDAGDYVRAGQVWPVPAAAVGTS